MALAHVYDGPAEEGERVIARFAAFGEPLLDFSGPMPYRTIQTLYDAIFPKGRDRCYWKSTYLKGLDDSVISEITAQLSQASLGDDLRLDLEVRRRHAARARRRYGLRRPFRALHAEPRRYLGRPPDDEANIGWVRHAWADMQRHSTGRLYLNFPGLGEDQSLVRNALGSSVYAQLQHVKRKYDPDNLFHMNQNIVPA